MVEINMSHVFTGTVDEIIHKSNFYLETDLNENYKPHYVTEQNVCCKEEGSPTNYSLPTFI